MSKELSEAEKQQLRKLRFNSGGNISTVEAKEVISKEKEKMIAKLQQPTSDTTYMKNLY